MVSFTITTIELLVVAIIFTFFFVWRSFRLDCPLLFIFRANGVQFQVSFTAPTVMNNHEWKFEDGNNSWSNTDGWGS